MWQQTDLLCVGGADGDKLCESLDQSELQCCFGGNHLPPPSLFPITVYMGIEARVDGCEEGLVLDLVARVEEVVVFGLLAG